MADKFNFDVIRQRLKSIDISLDLANTVKNESLGNFSNQGFNGKKWQEVQRRTPGTKAYRSAKGSARTRAILQGKGSGRLRRDVANSVSSGKRNSNWSYTLVVNNPYANIHNEGGTIDKGASTKTLEFKINEKTGRSKFAKQGKGNFQQDVNIGAHQIKIPQRKFMGMTPKLNKMLLNKINQRIGNIWAI